MSKLTHRFFWTAIVLPLGLYINANAQTTPTDTISRDYVINIKGDTVKGQVLLVNYSSVRIDPFSESHTIKYKASDIKEVCQTGAIYIPVNPSIGFRDLIMAKRIEHGAIDLFEYVQGGYNGNYQTTWFAGNAKIPPGEIKTSSLGAMSRSERRKHMLALLATNDELAKEFEGKKDYSWEYLQDLIRRYNKQAGAMGK